MIDYSSVDFINLLDSRLGLRNARMTAGGIEVNYSCHRPEHASGDESPSAYINSETGLFMCHGCKFHGTASDLVADVQQVSRATAERFLREIYGVEFDEPVGGSMMAETDARFRPVAPALVMTPPPESWLLSTRLDWFNPTEPFQTYMLDRGLSPEILTEYDIGYDYVSDRLTIPVRDLDGRLIGIKGRDWQGSHPAKYLVVGDRPDSDRVRYGFQTYNVSEVVFGLHRAREYRHIVIVEGELDSIALRQMGVPRAVATNTARMSQYQARLIIAECESVTILYDRGSAGEDAAPVVAEMLEPYISVKVAQPLDVDPCDALKYGRQDEILATLAAARSSLDAPHLFV